MGITKYELLDAIGKVAILSYDTFSEIEAVTLIVDGVTLNLKEAMRKLYVLADKEDFDEEIIEYLKMNVGIYSIAEMFNFGDTFELKMKRDSFIHVKDAFKYVKDAEKQINKPSVAEQLGVTNFEYFNGTLKDLEHEIVTLSTKFFNFREYLDDNKKKFKPAFMDIEQSGEELFNTYINLVG
jgi:hypothetical protein